MPGQSFIDYDLIVLRLVPLLDLPSLSLSLSLSLSFNPLLSSFLRPSPRRRIVLHGVEDRFEWRALIYGVTLLRTICHGGIIDAACPDAPRQASRLESPLCTTLDRARNRFARGNRWQIAGF